MNNQIILYDKQAVDCLIYSFASFTENEKNKFTDESELKWSDFSSARIICNFKTGLASSLLDEVGGITHYQISKKTPEDKIARNLGTFPVEELQKIVQNEGYYNLSDYNVKNNTEYIYSIAPVDSLKVQSIFESTIITNWEVFTLSPIYQDEKDMNRYNIVKDEFGENIVWSFQLNCSEGDITLTQDKTEFTTFAPKPKISVGDLNYHKGNLSCLLGNALYNDQYYEPNILLEKWNRMLKENHLYLFKNPKGDCMIVSLEDGTKRKYMNEVANYYRGDYNMQTAITNRPTTIEFSYIEVVDTENITIVGE